MVIIPDIEIIKSDKNGPVINAIGIRIIKNIFNLKNKLFTNIANHLIT